MSLEPIPFVGYIEIEEKEMNTNELIEALDQRYGNPYMAKEYGLIQQAIKELRMLQEEVVALREQVK